MKCQECPDYDAKTNECKLNIGEIERVECILRHIWGEVVNLSEYIEDRDILDRIDRGFPPQVGPPAK